MKDLEQRYGVNPADFCADVPKVLFRTHSKGTDSPLEILKDDLFNTASKKYLTKDQIKYVGDLIELVASRVKDNSELRSKLAKNENIFDAEEPYDMLILRKIYSIFTK